MTYKNYVCEGIDRLGKSTLINGLQDTIGPFNYLHYEKPRVTHQLLHKATNHFSQKDVSPADIKREALRLYQQQSFTEGFKLLSFGNEPDTPSFIFDRFHLGEIIYANRYRGYDGSYVMELEQCKEFKLANTLLVLLYTDDFSFITDDGMSFDVTQREREQTEFIKAWEISTMNKIKINVHNGHGGFKKASDILQEVLSCQ